MPNMPRHCISAVWRYDGMAEDGNGPRRADLHLALQNQHVSRKRPATDLFVFASRRQYDERAQTNHETRQSQQEHCQHKVKALFYSPDSLGVNTPSLALGNALADLSPFAGSWNGRVLLPQLEAQYGVRSTKHVVPRTSYSIGSTKYPVLMLRNNYVQIKFSPQFGSACRRNARVVLQLGGKRCGCGGTKQNVGPVWLVSFVANTLYFVLFFATDSQERAFLGEHPSQRNRQTTIVLE